MTVQYGGDQPIGYNAANALAKLILGPYGQYSSEDIPMNIGNMGASALVSGLQQAVEPYRQNERENVQRAQITAQLAAAAKNAEAHRIAALYQQLGHVQGMQISGNTQRDVAKMRGESLEKVANTGVEKARAANEWRENAPVKPGQWTGAMQNAAQQMMPAIIKEAKDKGEKIDQAQAWQRAQARVTQSLNPSVTPQQAAQVPGMMQGQWQNDINVTPGQGGARIVDPSAYAAAPPRAPGNNDRNGWFDPAMRKPVPYNMNTPEIRAYDLTSQAPQVPVPSAPYVPPSQNVGGWGETGQPPMLPSQSLPTDRMLNRWQQYDKSPKNPVLPSSRRTPEDFYSQMFPWIPTGTY